MHYIIPIRRLIVLFLVMHSFPMYSEIFAPYLLSPDKVPAMLSTSGQIYALSGDVTGDITITADDVTINLNERTVTGRIIISGERVLIYGGNIIAPAPADNATADAGVIQINVGADGAQIIDCYVSAEDSTVAGVRGARGMQVDANNVIVSTCLVYGGSSVAVGGLADGGIGLEATGQNLVVKNSQLQGGNGSDSSLAAVTSGAGGAGCNAVTNSSMSMSCSMSRGGNSGQLLNGANGITTGSGGNGITIASGAQVLINKSELSGGEVSPVTGPSMATTGSVISGNGGDGINSVAQSLVVYESAIQGGSVGNVTIVSAIGSAAFSFAPGNGGAALHVGNTAIGQTTVSSCSLIGGSCGAITTTSAGGVGINNIVGDFFGASAGNAVEVRQQLNTPAYAIIEYCDIQGGLAADITSASGLGTLAPVLGTSAGDGVVIDEGGSYVDIANCTIKASDGGDMTGVSFSANPNRTAGNGGNGIRVGDLFGLGGNSYIRIAYNQILAIGGGGDAPGGLGTSGSGGYGILVGDTVFSIEVSNNTITNSPGPGIGSASVGTAQFAIYVDATTNGSIVYGNVAYGILPATFGGGSVFFFPVGTAVDATAGTLFPAGTDRLSNIYQL